MDQDRFAARIMEYGNHVVNDQLCGLSASCRAFRREGSLLEDVIAPIEVQACVLRLVNAIQSPQHRWVEWKCLCFIASEKCYRAAGKMLTVFAASTACRPMLVYCGTVISSNLNEKEIQYCFTFLNLFMDQSNVRQEVVYNVGNVRIALLNYLTGGFAQSSGHIQSVALRVADNILHPFYCGTAAPSAESLMQGGALRAIKCAALHVISLDAAQDNIDRMTQALWVLWMVLHITMNIPWQVRARCAGDTYTLSRNDVFRVTIAVYKLLPSLSDEQLSVIVAGYGDYILEVWGKDVLQSYLLYKPPRETDAKPIVLQLAEWAICCGDTNQEKGLMKALRGYISVAPEIRNALRCLPPPPDRGMKGRYCALPDCPIEERMQLHNNLKKCSQCMAVYYCCREHQVEHWPAHKSWCRKISNA
jgi:hypothetical protein